jgi:hypothetical protein
MSPKTVPGFTQLLRLRSFLALFVVLSVFFSKQLSNRGFDHSHLGLADEGLNLAAVLVI